ncbi:MAG: ThuA protein [Chitinophagaceae bacterium]|nr:ThuA protein [Chitinophagaceae bacterium]
MLNKNPFLFLLFAFLLIAVNTDAKKKKLKILVFCKTAGYHHASIANGKLAIMQLGRENNFDVDTTSDASWFTSQNLKQYKAVVFLSTTGDIFNDEQQEAFKQYIHNGGGFTGVHAATDTEYDWEWYGKFIGAYFLSHPKQQEALLHVVDHKNISTRHLPADWKRKDEWYNFKNMDSTVHLLITLDESSYEGGKNGSYHPMAWYHNFEGGRMFYTALGHTEESYADPLFLKHLLGGILYAMGRKS